MDLSFVQEQLDTFATFAGAIGDFLQLPAKILGNLVDWFNGEEAHPFAVDDKGNPLNSDIEADWETTKGAFGSSSADDAPQGQDSGSSDLSLSSKSEDKK